MTSHSPIPSYIFSLQEMETNTEAYLRYDPAKENAWVKAIIESLKDNGKDYYRVDSKQYVTMLIIVIAKKNHKPFISEVASTYAGVGLMNMIVKKKYMQYFCQNDLLSTYILRETKVASQFASVSMTAICVLLRVIWLHSLIRRKGEIRISLNSPKDSFFHIHQIHLPNMFLIRGIMVVMKVFRLWRTIMSYEIGQLEPLSSTMSIVQQVH